VLASLLHALTLVNLGPVDDDYIVYRYAGNWLEGLGPVFNPGEDPVDGVTSPGWFLAAAAGLMAGLAPELWTPLVGVVSFGVLVGVVARWSRSREPSAMAELAPWWLALSPAVAWHAVAGLGTVPLAAAVAVGFHGWSRWALGGQGGALLPNAAFGVACALRAEALIPWAVCLLMMRPLRKLRGAEMGAAFLPLLVLALTAGMRWWKYGGPAPHALALKSLPLGVELEYGARYLVRSMGEGALSLMLLLAVLLPRGGAEARAISWTALAALLSVLVVGGDWMVYSRFLVPFSSVAAVGAAGLLSSLRPAGIRLSCAVASLSVFVLLGMIARPQAALERRFFEHHWLRAGAAFGELAPRGSTVAISPIGAFGWSSGLELVDVLGLTHPDLLERTPDLEGVGVKGHHRHDGGWVLDQEPDYLILGNGVIQPGTGTLDVNPWEADIVSDPRFEAMYRPLTLALDGGHGGAAVPYFAREGVRAIR
jgi:hypothetical protein